MSDEEDADPSKPSRRNRLIGAVARTRTKLTKRNKENATTVDDFLASGRTSTSTHRPSTSESFPSAPDRLEISQPPYQHDAQDAAHPADPISPPQPSPRRIVVPKIDVSSSQRYPGAQPLKQQNNEHSGSSMLRPDFQARVNTTSSLSKGRGRARGLSVQFTDRPPVVIGEGGDEAEAPTIEVGRAKARARSVSPPRSGGSPNKGIARLWNRSPLQHIPRAGTTSPKHAPNNASHSMQPPPRAPGMREYESVPSPGIKRVQTGMIGATPSPISESRQAVDKEFEMSMGISPATSNSPASSLAPSAEGGMIHAPKPIHPPVAVPNVKEMPILHGLKRENGTKSLRTKFHAGEGDVLRQARQADSPVSPLDSSDENFSPPPGPPAGKSASDGLVSPLPQSEFAHRTPQPPALPQSHSMPRRPIKEEYPPPPGPPPGRKPIDHLPPPQHEAPLGGHHVRRAPDEDFAPPPGPPPGRRAVNNTNFYASQPKQPGLPPPPPPPQRNPDDDYMGWVPDNLTQSQAPAAAFPGVDDSGKLAPVPGSDDKEESKTGKLRKKWFRKGS